MKKLHLIITFTLLCGFVGIAALATILNNDANAKERFNKYAPPKDRRGPFVHQRRSVRTRLYDTKHIRLELDFDFKNESFTGKATHRLSPFKSTKQINFDIAEMSILKVAVSQDKSAKGATPVEFGTNTTTLVVFLPQKVEAGKEITIVIDYKVTQPKSGAHFVIPKRKDSGKSTMVWTQSEPEFARYWFPCFDSPTDRTTSEIIATVPEKFMVLSNGDLIEKKKNNNGTKTWHWYQRKPHVPYLFSVVAGEFVEYRQQWDGIPVVSYVPPNRLADARRSFHKTPAMMKFFSEKIGVRYPWSKYSQICVDEYSGAVWSTLLQPR